MQIAKRILAATDFTELGNGAVDHALELAQVLDAQLSVVSVQIPFGGGSVDRDLAELRREMARLEERLRASGRLAHTVVQRGEPSTEILRVAGEMRADLIVMGTHSRKGLSRLIVGSTAEGVLRNAQVPVLVIKKAALRARQPEASPR